MRTEALLLAVGLAACVGRGGMDGDPRWEGWRYRQKLVLDPSGVTETLRDVPVLVHLELATYADTPLPRGELQLRDSDEVTELAFDVERWTDTDLTLWVRVPELVPGGDDHVWLVFGGGSAAPSAEVWSDGFAGVWHMVREGGLVDDASAGDNTGVVDGVPASGEHRAGGYLELRGLDVVRVPTGATSPLAVTGTATLEAYALASAPRTGWSTLVGRQYGELDEDHYVLSAIGQQLVACFSSCVFGPGNSLPLDTWIYVAAVREPSGALTLYRDGVVLNTADGGEARSDENDTTIGAQENSATSTVSEAWNGQISEVRVSNVARSADWLRVQALGFSAQLIEPGPVERLR